MKKAKIDNCKCLGADISKLNYAISTWNECYPCGFVVRYPMPITRGFEPDKSATYDDPNRKLARKLHIKYHRIYKI